MTLIRVRLHALLMVAVATASLLGLHATVATPVVLAAPCCNTCLDIGADFEALCDTTPHDETCTGQSGCASELYQESVECWRHCVWCSPTCNQCFVHTFGFGPDGFVHRLLCYESSPPNCWEW
jgi:hypothetical protein